MMRFGVLVVVAVCLFGGVQCGEKYWWMNQVSDVQFIDDTDKTIPIKRYFYQAKATPSALSRNFSQPRTHLRTSPALNKIRREF